MVLISFLTLAKWCLGGYFRVNYDHESTFEEFLAVRFELGFDLMGKSTSFLRYDIGNIDLYKFVT